MANDKTMLNGSGQAGSTEKQQQAEKGYLLKKHYVKNVNFQYKLQRPESYQMNKSPELNINVKTTPTLVGDNDYDVVLTIDVKGSLEGTELFNSSVSYAGIFSIKNLNDNEKSGLLGVECPHLLYPFARRIVMDLILESGFPAANLPPINFAVLYAKQQRELQQNAKSTGSTASTTSTDN